MCHPERFIAQKCRCFFRQLDYCLRVLYELQIYERAVDSRLRLHVSSAEDRKRARPSVCSTLPTQLNGNVFRPRMLCFGLELKPCWVINESCSVLWLLNILGPCTFWVCTPQNTFWSTGSSQRMTKMHKTNNVVWWNETYVLHLNSVFSSILNDTKIFCKLMRGERDIHTDAEVTG